MSNQEPGSEPERKGGVNPVIIVVVLVIVLGLLAIWGVMSFLGTL